MMATNTASRSLDHDPLLGKTVGGRYAIDRLIGRGGVGLVYLAQDTKESRQVVVKVLAPHWTEDGDAVARFDREAQRMARLDHPNVVKMYDHGHFQGQTYIVMEFIRGEPLRRYLNRRKRLPLEEFVPIAWQILLGAGYVHERGIMMRDIKPPNIMLCEHDGKANHVKLLDFGLAKLIEEEEEDEITKAHVIGTAAYMSPEQIKGEKIDVRVDVYALGVLFFLMLTGEQPISGDNDAAVLVNHVHGKPKSLAERLPKGHRIPRKLIALIERCLAKDPDERPADAAAMAKAMSEIVPRPLLELPKATTKTRAPAEAYWAARMNSTSAAMAAIQADVSDSAEWTRPLLRRAAKTGQAPLKLAEAEVEAQKQEVQRPIKPKPRPRSPTGSGLKPRPRSPTGSGLKPRPRSPTGSGLRPRPRPPKDLGPPPSPPKNLGAPPQPPKDLGPPPSPPRPSPTSTMGSRPSPATVRVTAADAREAVERLEEDLQEKRDLAALAARDSSPSEVSDLVPISLDEEVEEIEEVEEVEEVEGIEVVEPAESEPLAPIPMSGLGSGLQKLPTMPSQPLETDALGALTSGSYLPAAATSHSDGMRLGAIVAVAGLVALVLGGLTAFLVLGGDDDEPPPPSEEVEVVAAPEQAEPSEADPDGAPAASEATGDVGTVEVRAIEGARVEIDGEDRGAVPISVELPLGEHRVKVTAAGHYPWQTTIDVRPGANAAVKAELVEMEAAAAAPTPTPEPKAKSNKRPRPRTDKSEPKSTESKPKPKPKSDVFMDPSKKKDDGIFMPVGGK